MKQKWIRKTLLIIVVIFLFIGLLSCFFLNYALKPTPKHFNFEYITKQYPHIHSWLDSLETNKALKDTFIFNENGVKLHAYYALANRPTANTALIVHGYRGNAISMFHIGYMYNKEFNYNIIVPDLQYHGESEGKCIQMGWNDRLDVLEWMDIAHMLVKNEADFVLHGISMGAATIMMLSGEDMQSNVKCFVEDCGYTSVWDEFASEGKVRFNLPSFPILYTTSGLCNLLYGWNFKEASSLNAVRKCTLPMLFIHGDKDTFVPTEMVYKLYEAKPEPKELWIVPGAAHAVSYKNNPKEYTSRVGHFIKKYMN
ncbi:MAG: alpha/beta hydrolase [Bacteroidales bacterium]|nr:alpha/beta hydrolase [Bacteroidales bacterium]